MITAEPVMTRECMGTDPSAPKPADFIPEKTFPFGHSWAGKPRCWAWSHGIGRQCSRIPTKGKNVCRSHAGAGARPPEHGRLSLPSKLSEAFSRSQGLQCDSSAPALDSARRRQVAVDVEIWRVRGCGGPAIARPEGDTGEGLEESKPGEKRCQSKWLWWITASATPGGAMRASAFRRLHVLMESWSRKLLLKCPILLP
jgi:hypothetical protein